MSGELVKQLADIVGRRNIRVNTLLTEYYRSGFRSGKGSALAVVWPRTLVQQWQVLHACVRHHAIIIMQAANTGLTEGSTPSGDNYDRDIVIINTLKMNKIFLVNRGKQIISLPGATLHSLEQKLDAVGRTPHSVIGSSCIGASIAGGVANNSGGALVNRGPAYTELALFAQVNAEGKLELINHLGIENLGTGAEKILQNLEKGNFSESDIQYDERAASDIHYTRRIRNVDTEEPARYNADQTRLYEASGCAGKLAVFALRLDTFPKAEKQRVYYLGTNDTVLLSQLRRRMLKSLNHLPDIAEYIHRDIFNIAEKYGKDTFLLIDHLGTRFMPRMFAIKGIADAYLNKVPFLPKYLSDRILQAASRLWPSHLPRRMLEYRDRYEHHLILKVSDEGIDETDRLLSDFFSNIESDVGSYFQCDEKEANKAYLQRFAAAGSAIRYQLMQREKAEDVIALDIALRPNDTDWFETLPPHIEDKLIASLYYGHFLCHVFHQDYVVKKGVDTTALKQEMLQILNRRGAKYPAEHNVGHLYKAEPQLVEFYRQLDPTNTFNPGIGKTSKRRCCDGIC